MGYDLQAVIAAEDLLRRVASGATGTVVVPIESGLALLPMTDEFFDSVTLGPRGPEPRVFWKLPNGFDAVLVSWSAGGPVAYVEADYGGGGGYQTAQVWDSGVSVLGPLHIAPKEPVPTEGTPVSRALRHLGVVSSGGDDEFVAAGLKRFGSMESWLDLPDEWTRRSSSM